MSQHTERSGPPRSRLNRPRVRGEDAKGRKRSFYLDPETDAVVVALARDLKWSESYVVVRLLHLAVLPFCGRGGCDVQAIKQRLVGLELERVTATEGA